jgi:hypothetical protein
MVFSYVVAFSWMPVIMLHWLPVHFKFNWRNRKSVMDPVQRFRSWGGGCRHPVIWSFRSCTFTQFCLLCEFLVITDDTNSLLKFSSLGVILQVILWSVASILCTLPTISELKVFGHPLWGSWSTSFSASWKYWHHKNVCVDDRALSPSRVCNISCVSLAVFPNFMEICGPTQKKRLTL